MGQKVNPNGFRYGITKEHNTKWFADKSKFSTLLLEDQKIYKFFDKLVRQYQIGSVEIKRNKENKVLIRVHSAKSGALLGQNGENIKLITTKLQKVVKNRKLEIAIDVQNIAKPELNARLAAEQIAIKLENRESFRIAQKFAIRNAMKAGAKGIKTSVSGRLNGVDMARTEGYSEGEMKLHTLRQKVEYARATARTTYGAIGVKVWISLGEILEGGNKNVTTKKD
ncbi:30S ribosomal protein S3 [Mycoplasma elephantis]|uniref:30S ribosomal protein S3 n=1 Tax=Mycoplasma elephantis TaxID=114882 RepID=UPI000482670B|nr:30S ribosomal protein S3 [Mycoplasma elephantis]